MIHKAGGEYSTNLGLPYIDATPVWEWRSFQGLLRGSLGTTRVTESDKSTFASGGHKLSLYVTLCIPYWEMTKALPTCALSLYVLFCSSFSADVIY